MSPTDVLTSRFTEFFRREAAPDRLVEEAVAVVKSNPNMYAADALVEVFWQLARDRPQQVDQTTALFARIIHDTQSVIVESTEWDDHPFPFFFDLYLHELLKTALFEDTDGPFQTKIVPENAVLIAAMTTALCWKHGFTVVSSTTAAFSGEGLNVHPYTADFGKEEVTSLGTCLQLLIAGRTVVEKIAAIGGFRGAENALKALQASNICKSADGMRLVSKALDLAAKDFSESLSSSEAWSILFPAA